MKGTYCHDFSAGVAMFPANRLVGRLKVKDA